MAKVVITLELNDRILMNEGMWQVLGEARLASDGHVVIDGTEVGTWVREEGR